MATFHEPPALAGARRSGVAREELPGANGQPLRLLSVVIPAHNEEDAFARPSSTSTWSCGYTTSRTRLSLWTTAAPIPLGRFWWKRPEHIPELKPVQKQGENGFGRSVTTGFDSMSGDAVVVMMADESDDCRDVGTLLGDS